MRSTGSYKVALFRRTAQTLSKLSCVQTGLDIRWTHRSRFGHAAVIICPSGSNVTRYFSFLLYIGWLIKVGRSNLILG